MTQPNRTTVEIHLRDGMRFESAGMDGVTVLLDSSSDHGGTGGGFRPMELLLVGLGSCTGMDVISILRKKRMHVTAYRVDVTGTNATEYPRVFTHIRVRHLLYGSHLTDEAVRRAIELSETKYCPAYAMLSKAATISTEFEVRPSQPVD